MYSIFIDNVWNANCVRAVAFIFDSQTDVLESKVLRQKMSSPRRDSKPQRSDSYRTLYAFELLGRSDIYDPVYLNTYALMTCCSMKLLILNGAYMWYDMSPAISWDYAFWPIPHYGTTSVIADFIIAKYPVRSHGGTSHSFLLKKVLIQSAFPDYGHTELIFISQLKR